RLLDETWPGDTETKSILLNSGAEAVENAVKIARTATGRTGVIVFDHAFHGRTSLTMAMTAKVVPYKQGFGPFPGEVYRAVAPYLLVSGKSLGGGLPLAGVTGRAEVIDSVAPGGLGGTFGGNPVACAAAAAVLEEVRTESFRARAEEIGKRLRTRLDDFVAQ